MLAFRHIDATPADPVERWGVEGILAAIERGGLAHHRRIMAAALAAPWGSVAKDLLQACTLTQCPIAGRMAALLEQARGGEEAVVQRRIRDAIDTSRLSLRGFAAEVGTSPSRLSSYATGKVQPSAATMLRIENASRRLR